MSVTAGNILMGPGVLYFAAFGATEPADIDTAPGTAWTDLGGTKDGVVISVAQEFADLEVDQLIMPVGRRKTKEEWKVSTNLAEATLENLARATNVAVSAVTAGTGVKTFAPGVSAVNAEPTYGALIFEGLAPGGHTRRFIARKVLAVASPEIAYKKGEQTTFRVEWVLNYVSDATAPYEFQDETA